MAELVDEANKLGRHYLAVTDHSRSRPLGLDAALLREQGRELRALDARLHGRPRLLHGVEVDILRDGSLDLPTEELAALHGVVASACGHRRRTNAGGGDAAARLLYPADPCCSNR